MSRYAPAPDMPRHEFAYLVMAHNRPDQVLRLLHTLRAGSPQALLLLHYDSKEPLPDPARLEALGVQLVEPRVAVHWGGVPLLDAMLRGIGVALERFDFVWLSVISGQDYPLRPLCVIENELRESTYDAFVKAAPAGSYRARYHSRFWPLPRFHYHHRIPTRLRSWLTRTRHRLNEMQSLIRIEGGPRATPLQIGIFWPTFGSNFTCYKGSDWFTLSRRAAEYLLDFGHNHPQVLAHYRRTFVPSESYFQTVLWNARQLKLSEDYRRFIVWEQSSLAHPVTLTMRHLEAMVGSGKDFGRKFDMNEAPDVLDALDRLVLGHAPPG